jgi:hypothetical protein
MAKKFMYSDQSRRIVNKYKKRLGEDLDNPDPFALEALEREMSNLMNEQESERSRLGYTDSEQYQDGGYLNGRKPRLNNLSTSFLSTPPVDTIYGENNPRYNFLNLDSRKFIPSTQFYNGIPKYRDEVNVSQIPYIEEQFTPNFNLPNILNKKKTSVVNNNSINTQPTTYGKVKNTNTPKVTKDTVNSKYNLTGMQPLEPITGTISDLNEQSLPRQRFITGTDQGTSTQNNRKLYKTRVSPLGLLPVIASGIATNRYANQLSKMNIPEIPLSMSELNLSKAKEEARLRGLERRNIVKGVAGIGASPSQRFARTASGLVESDRITGNEINQLATSEATYNTQTRNQFALQGAENNFRRLYANMLNKQTAAGIKAQNTSDVASGVTSYLQDVNKARQYDAAMQLSSSDYGLELEPSYVDQPLYKKLANRLLGNEPYRLYNKSQRSI